MENKQAEDHTIKLNPDYDINFHVNNGQLEIMRLCSNGDIFVKGNLVENDKEVVDGLREFLEKAKGQSQLREIREKIKSSIGKFDTIRDCDTVLEILDSYLNK